MKIRYRSFWSRGYIVDCLLEWWQIHQHQYPDIRELALDLDGGSAVRSNRTQFITRLSQFAQTTGLRGRLIYYPPYHSKYNPIERCWAALENYWNGALLNTIEANYDWRYRVFRNEADVQERKSPLRQGAKSAGVV
ncbi:MAG: hypothetical protein AAF827_21915 [Cyanobacteria bacterium P01_D01_bin.6]